MKKISNYTDHHDVDEDKMTVIFQGGFWNTANDAGVTHQDMTVSPGILAHIVASSDI